MRLNFRLGWFRVEIFPKLKVVFDVRRTLNKSKNEKNSFLGCLFKLFFIIMCVLYLIFIYDNEELPIDNNKSNVEWIGNWKRSNSDENNSSSLIISKAVEDCESFYFEISTFKYLGAGDLRTGEIEGRAIIKESNSAIFEDIESKCCIVFFKEDDILELETNNECSMFSGVGVYFDGKYSVEK